MTDPFQLLEGSANARKAVFIGLFVWMLANPIGGQILGLDTRWLRPWTMFGGVGVGLYDVRVFSSTGNELKPITWNELGYSGEGGSRSIPHLRSPEQVQQVVLQLCADSENPAVLRALIRRATPDRWQAKVSTDINICLEPLHVE